MNTLIKKVKKRKFENKKGLGPRLDVPLRIPSLGRCKVFKMCVRISNTTLHSHAQIRAGLTAHVAIDHIHQFFGEDMMVTTNIINRRMKHDRQAGIINPLLQA